MSTPPPPLDKARHLKYWTRCLRSPLPHQYTGNDSSRLLLAFFIVGAIELLTLPSDLPNSPPTLPTPISPSDLLAIRSWVLSLAHPSGAGFCGSPNMLPASCFSSSTTADDYDPLLAHSPVPSSPESANIAATFFGIILLAMCTPPSSSPTAFHPLNRRAILLWLRRLQRPDGSFGEFVDSSGIAGGGRDMRYCYLAASIRWYLRDPEATPEEDAELDFDVEKLVAYIRAGQTFDGGVAESGSHESHAGYAYCAVAALYMLDRPGDGIGEIGHVSSALEKGIVDRDAFVRFCVSRQFAYLESSSSSSNPDNNDEGLEEEEEEEQEDEYNFYLPRKLASLSLDSSLTYIAFNGRCNKVADTCYTWWAGGALSLVSRLDVLDPTKKAVRAFLMDKTQHMVGGFSKYPGGPPDLYHSYLGLAALANLDRTTDDLPLFDIPLCVSGATVARVVCARKSMLAREKEAMAGKGMGARLLALAKSVVGREEELGVQRKKAASAYAAA